jgi:hypothetical protein
VRPVALGVGALLLVACHATGEGTATPAEAAAPGTSAAAPASTATPQVARFHLAPSEHGKRTFVPGLSLSRTDATGASAPVAIVAPPGDAGSGGDTSAVVPGPGHYRAHFLVARCAPDSPDGTCRAESPKPDDVDFDMPATGDLDVSVR